MLVFILKPKMTTENKQAGTKLVQVKLSAWTVSEFTEVVEVPADATPAELEELVQDRFDRTDFHRYHPDPESFKQGDCYTVAAAPGEIPAYKAIREGGDFIVIPIAEPVADLLEEGGDVDSSSDQVDPTRASDPRLETYDGFIARVIEMLKAKPPGTALLDVDAAQYYFLEKGEVCVIDAQAEEYLTAPRHTYNKTAASNTDRSAWAQTCWDGSTPEATQRALLHPHFVQLNLIEAAAEPITVAEFFAPHQLIKASGRDWNVDMELARQSSEVATQQHEYVLRQLNDLLEIAAHEAIQAGARKLETELGIPNLGGVSSVFTGKLEHDVKNALIEYLMVEIHKGDALANKLLFGRLPV